MKPILFLLAVPSLVLLLAVPATAQEVNEEFSGANRAPFPNAELIGKGWLNGGGPGMFALSNGEVTFQPALLSSGSESIIIHRDAMTSGDGFQVSATLRLVSDANPAWAGLVFNYHNPQTYYSLGFNGEGWVHFARVSDGESSLLAAYGPFAHVPGQPVSIAITSELPGSYHLLVNDGKDGCEFLSLDMNDPEHRLTDGLAGILANNRVTAATDFRSTSAPPQDAAQQDKIISSLESYSSTLSGSPADKVRHPDL